jgi:ankyrin repeat protein
MDLFATINDSNMDALSLLLARDVDVNQRNDSDETPLMVAVGTGSLPMVHTLLEAGASTNAINTFGFSALGSALWCSHMDIAKCLVEAGASVSIDQAAALGDLECLKREWSNPFPEIEEVIGAFLGACRIGQGDVIKWFLNAGVPFDLHPPGDEWGGIDAPGLHHAAENGHADTVELLLEHGTDHSLVDDVHQS